MFPLSIKGKITAHAGADVTNRDVVEEIDRALHDAGLLHTQVSQDEV